ncbi:unnamed protein product [Closterium sp. Yama58-4]|nr:unnamed protein product [Closterium sp. Yama58-4]
MPKIKTNRVKYPEGWELIEPTLRELEQKMREAESDTHEGKRKCEAVWPIFKIAHQKSRFIYDLYYRRKAISKELYDFCLEQKHADASLIAKWKKAGFERLCCVRCMQPKDHNFGTTCVCRVPKHLREEKVIECIHCGCRGSTMAATRLLAFLLLLLVSHAVLSSAAPRLPKRVALTVQAHAQRLRARAAALSTNSQGLFSELRGAATPAATGGPIKYNGGPVIVGNPTVNIYHIYYGSWPTGSGQDYIDNFVRSLSSDSGAQGSSSDPTVKGWWAITSNYYQSSSGAKKNVSSKVRLAGTTYDNYSYGKALTDNNVLSIVKSKIGSGKAFAYDPHGIYVLISSKDVTESSGFCSQYCGWHDAASIGSSPLYYAFVGHHAQCPNACGVKSTSPNGNPAIDATISTLAHEITEAATDPDAQSGWFDAGGEENGDLHTFTAATPWNWYQDELPVHVC